MKRKITRLLLSAILMMCCTVMYAKIEPTQPQTDGNGNYELSTAAELYWFANYVNSGNTSANAILTADITVNESVLDSNGDLASGTFETWTPIGEGADDKAYSGEFNGNGHTISGLYVNNDTKDNVGLFGKTASGACIHDLGISDSYFLGHNHVGGICGDFAYGRIKNCWNGATIVGTDYDAGGISGSCWLYASIANCYNVGNVSLSKEDYHNRFAGICGSVYSTTTADYTIDNCYTLGSKCSKIHGFLVNGCPETKIHNSYVKESDDFKSGEVCWLLNNGVTNGDQKWYQTLGTDDVPSLSTSRGIIFKITNDQGECEYANAKCQHEQTYKSYQAAVCPTATTTGRYGHWHCSHCSTDFTDESCTIEATEENLTVPVATNKEIWYTTINNQKLKPYSTNAFGATYDDANNVYEKGLGKIAFDKDITSFGNDAFWRCVDLTSIEIPNSVTSIGGYAFSGCI